MSGVAAVEAVGDKGMSWASVLADLARDAAEHERILASIREGSDDEELPAPAPWTPPSGLGPLPVNLREQAMRVLAKQLDFAVRMTEAQTHNAEQQRLADRLNGGYARTTAPAFFDTAL